MYTSCTLLMKVALIEDMDCGGFGSDRTTSEVLLNPPQLENTLVLYREMEGESIPEAVVLLHIFTDHGWGGEEKEGVSSGGVSMEGLEPELLEVAILFKVVGEVDGLSTISSKPKGNSKKCVAIPKPRGKSTDLGPCKGKKTMTDRAL